MGFVEAWRIRACRVSLLMFAALPTAMAYGEQQAAPAPMVLTAPRLAPAADDFGQSRTDGVQKVRRTTQMSDAFSRGFEHAHRTPAVRLPKQPANPLASPPIMRSGPVFEGGGIR